MKKNENTTAVWIRAKLRADKPFVLDELTPSGLKLFVALGWKDNFNGYRDAKKKVADRVPARDWSLIDPESSNLFLQKSEEIDSGKNKGSYLFLQKSGEIDSGETRGRSKQLVAISANGMKHLLAHVPNQDLAGTWLQYLIDAEKYFRRIDPADPRLALSSDHVKNHGAVISHLGVEKGVAAIAIANNKTFSQSKQEIQRQIKETKGLKGNAKDINQWHHATEKTMGVKSVSTTSIRLAALYAPKGASAHTIGSNAARASIAVVEDLSGGEDVAFIRGKDGHFRKAIHFQIREGPAMSPATARQLKEKDKQFRKDEASLTESCQQELL
jgi:hypothetical protein